MKISRQNLPSGGIMGHEYVSGVRDFASEPKKRVKTTNLSLAAKVRGWVMMLVVKLFAKGGFCVSRVSILTSSYPSPIAS